MADQAAPGWPGIEPRWTSSAKSGIGTAASSSSRVWFTLSHGIINEVYYPSVDTANIRDCGFLVADGASYFSEEKRDCTSVVTALAPGVPGFRVRNTSHDGRYMIEKTVITHPHLDSLLQHVRFVPNVPGLHLYLLLAPHINNGGHANNGWTGNYKGVPMLFAQRGDIALALASSAPLRARSIGYVGTSDGWQDLATHYQFTSQFDSAANGNIALCAELDLDRAGNEFVIAVGFGTDAVAAGQVARLSVEQRFSHLEEHFVRDWVAAGADDHGIPSSNPIDAPLASISVAVLRAHESKRVPGGFVASLSIPWGNSQGDDDLGGYHLVWPRDLTEIAGGLLAAGDPAAARRAFQFLVVTQEADGSWAQNMWLDGRPYWLGTQMDEIALPILLAEQLRCANVVSSVDAWPTVRKAASYLVRNGPVTPEDRWEEDPGYAPFTLAVEIAALLVAADFAARAGDSVQAAYLRDTADLWNDNIERWTYASGTDLAQSLGIDGYYVRIAPENAGGAALGRSVVWLKNRPAEASAEPAAAIVSPDALALVRFGLRRPDDPRIVATVRAIDAILKSETANGPVWHRYPGDGYGEHEDGSPFDGTGIGRGWPLFAGERGHYELALGNRAEAQKLLATMALQAGDGGLLPEQVWDAPDISERELFNGRPAGSAMPLAWAHAEYLKLARSLADGAVFDTPAQTGARYGADETHSNLTSWRFNNKCSSMVPGSRLRVEALAPAAVVWTTDDWRSQGSVVTRDTGLGVYIADLSTESLPQGGSVEFTFRWLETGNWEGTNFRVAVA